MGDTAPAGRTVLGQGPGPRSEILEVNEGPSRGPGTRHPAFGCVSPGGSGEQWGSKKTPSLIVTPHHLRDDSELSNVCVLPLITTESTISQATQGTCDYGGCA